jgi:hypothetical protein
MAKFSVFSADMYTDILVASVPEGVTEVPELPVGREWKSAKADAPFIYIGGTGPVTYRRCTADVSKQTPVTLAQLEAVIARIRPRCPPESDYKALDKFTKIPALYSARAEAMRQCLTFVHMLTVNYAGCVACAVRACAALRPESLFVFVDADADCDKHAAADRITDASGTWYPSAVHVHPRSYDRELILSGRQFINTAVELAAMIHVGACPVIRHAIDTVVCNADLPADLQSLDPNITVRSGTLYKRRVTAYGAWIAERTVEEHKKKIEAESDPDQEPDTEEDLQAEEDEYQDNGREVEDELETEMQLMTEQLENAFPRTRKRTVPASDKKRARDGDDDETEADETEADETDAKEARTDA